MEILVEMLWGGDRYASQHLQKNYCDLTSIFVHGSELIIFLVVKFFCILAHSRSKAAPQSLRMYLINIAISAAVERLFSGFRAAAGDFHRYGEKSFSIHLKMSSFQNRFYKSCEK